MKLLIAILLALLSTVVYSQSDTTILLKKRLSYYPNGQLKTLETFRKDSTLIKEYGVEDCYIDTCRDGLYQEWYENGKLKTVGQYVYLDFIDTISVMNVETGEMIDVEQIINESEKSGIWNHFDSTGVFIKTVLFKGGREFFIKGANKDTTIIVETDSFRLKLDYHFKTNSYLIQRKKNNKSLIVEFPIHNSMVNNYVSIYPYYSDLFSFDKGLLHDFQFQKNALYTFMFSDAGPYITYFDLAQLDSGKYYIYYRSQHKPYYVIEIIIQDI
ncbi:MAG: hypothetical protein K9H64_00205 [Bacteroidales bacterium]|nr:hypothetical protein [Bacteroidales bacterium]MCF8454316.1 hypothetical protein [Bacteroidales bacterium]